MKQAVNNVGMVVQSLQKELMRLTDASKEGQLSERGKPEQFQGAYADIVRGVNAMLDAILLPIGEGNRILAQISNGKIDELIAQTYKGDHEKMKQAVNNVGIGRAGPAKRTDAPDRCLQGRTDSPNAASPSSSRAPTPTSCAASTPCWTRFCCPSAKATAFWRKISSGKIDELIAQTYKGDHEKMKTGRQQRGIVLQACRRNWPA